MGFSNSVIVRRFYKSKVCQLLNCLKKCIKLLEKSTVFEVVFDDDVSDGIKYKSNVVGISGTCAMSINFFCIFAFVQVFEFHLNVSSGILVCVGTWKETSKIKQVFPVWTSPRILEKYLLIRHFFHFKQIFII